MMKSYLSLAMKELKAQKVMAALILLAVILSSIMTTVVGRSVGILQSMRIEQASSLNGDRHASFHQLTAEQADVLKDDDRLYDVGSSIFVGSTELENSGLTLQLREYDKTAVGLYPTVSKVKEGRLPERPDEIALPEDVLQYLPESVKVGDPITLDADVSGMDAQEPAYVYSHEYTLCGILESNYVGYVTGIVTGIVGEGTAKKMLPDKYNLYSMDFKVKDTGAFQETVDSLADSLGIGEKYIQYNWLLLNAMGIRGGEESESADGEGFSYMTAACVLVGMLVLLAAGLVIYNILKIAVAKRIREYGTLRAIGGERGQLYRIVALQLLILCGIGIPIGLVLGIFSAKGILSAATGLINPELFLVENAQQLDSAISAADSGNALSLAASIIVTLVFAILAAFPAARYAAKVSPTVAMQGQAVKVKRRGRKARRIRNFEAYYARLNLKRGRGRTAITILSLVMSITVFVALQSFSSILDAGSAVQQMHTGDYSVANEAEGIRSEQVEEIREQEAVESLAVRQLTIYSQNDPGGFAAELNIELQPSETFQIAGMDLESLMEECEGLTEQDKQELSEGKACLVKNPISITYEGEEVVRTELKKDDVLSVNGRELRVAGITDAAVTINNQGFVNGVQMMVTPETYTEMTGDESYKEVFPTLKEDADTEAFETWLAGWCSQNPGTMWLSYRETDAQLAESFEQIRMLCWGLIIFIGLIGILNIINTVYSNIHTRVSEIGMQRAVGMSRESLYKTFLWEGAYYGIIASVAGAVFGYISTVFISAATTDTLTLVPVPVLPVAEAAVLSVAACLLATAVPLRFIARMNIVEAIEAVE